MGGECYLERRKEIGERKKAYNIPKTNLPRCPHGPAMMSPKIHIKPTNNNRHRAIRPHRHHKKRRILKPQIIMHRDQDRKARNRDTDRYQREKESMTEFVGQVRDDHSEAEGTSPRRDTIELCLDGPVAVGSDDAWGEESIAV